jgi:transposase
MNGIHHMSLTYFAKPPQSRDQKELFPRTLDDAIPDDHPVRVLDELLDLCDFSQFEAQYHGSLGQPPYPPKTLVKVWLFALTCGIRSSRDVAYALRYSVDFMWLANGFTIGHVTLSNFRRNFGEPLKCIFQQLVRLALEAGVTRINQVTFDGTRVKSNNSRRNTRTAAGLEKQIAQLDQEIAEYLKAAEQADQEHDSEVGTADVDPQMADRQQRKQTLEDAKARVAEMDAERRRRQGKAAEQTPAQIPMTDPDSRLLPNKEGGTAPNYTPTTVVDVESDLILSADVLDVANEHPSLVPALQQIEADFGVRPAAVLTDGLNSTGQNIAALEDSGTELYSPVAETSAIGPNPADRPDPTQPVPEEQRGQLPLTPQGILDRSCFVYDAEQDVYYCPMGQPLAYEQTKPREISGETLQSRIYRCGACAGCPLAERCLSKQTKHGRTMSRDEYTPHRERHAKKMATAAAQEIYKQRLHPGETPFAHIKHLMGLRQFLLRGLELVRTEWRWACTAYNVKKLIQKIEALRSRCAQTAIGEA